MSDARRPLRALAHLGIVLAAASGVSASTRRAWAADADAQEPRRREAQVFFAEGLRLATAGDDKAALRAFREAHARAPSFRVLYNIGRLCARTGDAACAVRAYEGYLRDGGKDVPAKRRKDVESDIRLLSRTVARLSVTADVDGADVTVDDEGVGQTPLREPIVVNGGAHTVVASRDGARAEGSVTVVSGGTASIDLTLRKEEPPPPVEPPPAAKHDVAPRSAAASGSPSTVPWLVAGGFGAVTLVSGVLAANAWADYEETRGSFPITRDELDSAHGKARDLFLLTAALGAATVVSAGVATYFTLGGRPPEPGAEKKSGGARPRRIALLPTLGGLVVVGGLP